MTERPDNRVVVAREHLPSLRTNGLLPIGRARQGSLERIDTTIGDDRLP
ncbi:hypothetical protein [Tautonia rosea]|nr:hypothetical protein [Tautonia rosea]